MRKISNARSSRRAPPLKDSDYDHEINLVDHAAESIPPQALSPEPADQTDHVDHALATSDATDPNQTLSKPSNAQSNVEVDPETDNARQSRPDPSTSSHNLDDGPSYPTINRKASAASKSSKSTTSNESLKQASSNDNFRGAAQIPQVEVQQPTPFDKPDVPIPANTRQRAPPQTAIDVLYENQRGGFLCSIPLFSPKALGQLDPTAWTNVAHKPSPTNIRTAQVPDPSWVWVWPEWRINHETGVDEDGWEYSFMFSKKFSWHSPKWYNSFVRRRAWIRMRAQRQAEELASDPHMLNTEYFTVSRASVESMAPLSKTGSSRHSRASMSTSSAVGLESPIIGDIESLMLALGKSRIDREKIETVESFLEHGEEDLSQLQHKMHDIMALFVFQASRRVLISKLSEAYEQTQKEIEEHSSERLQNRLASLNEAIIHADEECKQLEYWSDIRKIVKEGDTNMATERGEWGPDWAGVDNSGGHDSDVRLDG